LLKLIFRRVKPLKHADFSAVEVRRGLQRMFTDIDLDNPQIQQALRRLTLSLEPIIQVRQLGHRAFERAARLDTPTLVIQGKQDRVVRPSCTVRLINRFPTRVQYQDVQAGHDLIDPGGHAWDQIKDCLLVFAESIRARDVSRARRFASTSVVDKHNC
jgi:pimeloyl-ACP methyl ester carboxylesterase